MEYFSSCWAIESSYIPIQDYAMLFIHFSNKSTFATSDAVLLEVKQSRAPSDRLILTPSKLTNMSALVHLLDQHKLEIKKDHKKHHTSGFISILLLPIFIVVWPVSCC